MIIWEVWPWTSDPPVAQLWSVRIIGVYVPVSWAKQSLYQRSYILNQEQVKQYQIVLYGWRNHSAVKSSFELGSKSSLTPTLGVWQPLLMTLGTRHTDSAYNVHAGYGNLNEIALISSYIEYLVSQLVDCFRGLEGISLGMDGLWGFKTHNGPSLSLCLMFVD